jgi:hypothetical protein
MFLRRKKSTTDLLKERVYELTETLGELATELSGKAAVALGPTVVTAREAASSAYDQASTKMREDVVPKVRGAAAPAVGAALARAQTHREPEKKHRLRTLLILLGLGGAAAYAAKKLGFGGGASQSSSFGQSSPSGSSYAGTTSSTTPTRPTAVPDARDSGAAFGDADAELGHDVTDEFSEDRPQEGAGADPGFSTEFTTTPPTEAMPSDSDSDSDSGSKPTP